MPAETVDVLELSIKTSAGRAKQSLDKLATSIDTFGSNVSKYVDDMSKFSEALQKIADAAGALKQVGNLGSLIRSAANGINSAAKGSARIKNAAEAAKIRKQENAAWKQYAEWNKDYKQSHRLNWKEVKRNSDLYANRDKVPDNTAKEIAEWKAVEDARDEAQRMTIAYGQAKKYTEELVEALSVGTKDTKKIVEDMTGISRQAKSAAASMGDFLLAEEEAKKVSAERPFNDDQIAEATNRNSARSRELWAKSMSDIAAREKERNEIKAKVQETLAANGLKDPILESIKEKQDEISEAEWRQFERMEREMNQDYKDSHKLNWKEVERQNELYDIAKNGPMMPDNTKEEIAQWKAMEDAADAAARSAFNETPNNIAENFMESSNQADILQMKLDGVAQKLGEALESGNPDPSKIARLADQYNKLKEKIDGIAQAAKEAVKEGIKLREVFGTADGMIANSFLGKLTGQLFRVAKMRGLRAIVKELAAGFKEGISNLYGWSDKIGGHFAGAMDTIASKAMLAKNSIATAFAPAIEALVPVLSTVVSWIHAASNALAQFIALITGQNSWTEAVETAEDWGGAVKGAGGAAKSAAKEVKDLLADWDELNIIQSKGGDGSGGGGGGGGKAAVDYAKMFKENFKFDEWTRYFEQIKNIAIAIGVAIAGWKLIDMASTFLKKIGVASDTVDTIAAKLGKALTGMVLLTISFELAEITGKDIARNGVTLKNALTGIGSLLSGALGGYFLASAINPAFGVIGAVAGLTMSLAVGFKAYVDEKRAILYENVDEYLEKNVMSKVFTFDVNAAVEKVNTTVANVTKARQDVQTQLSAVMTSIEVLKLGIDEGESWTEIYNQVLGKGGLLEKIKTNLSEDKNVITLYYETKSRSSLEGKANGTTVANGMKTELMANSWLTKEYTRLGKEFGDCFVEGEVAAIKEGKERQALAILQSITDAELAAENARAAAEINVDLRNRISDLDDDVVMEEMSSIFSEYEQKLADARKKIAEEHYITLASTLAELKSLGADDTLIQSVQALLDEAQKELDEGNWVLKVHAEFFEDEKKMFGDELVKRYGPELAQLVSSLSGEYLSDLDFLTEVMNKGGYDSFVQGLMQDFMTKNLPGEAKKWLLDNGIDISDFFTEDQKKKVLEGKNRIEPDMVEEVFEDGLDGTADRINAEVDSILEVIRENAEKSGMSVEDYIAGMDAGEIWPLLENIKEVLDRSNLNGGEQAALDETGGVTSDLLNDNIDELYQLLKDKYAEDTKDNSWFNPEHGMTVDAATSGMALDATMENVGNALTGNSDKTNSLLDKVATRIADLLTATNNLADRPVQVNLGVSSLLGDLFGRSSDAYGKATG